MFTSVRRVMFGWLVFVTVTLTGGTLFSQSLNPELIAGAAANMLSVHEVTNFNFFPGIPGCGRFTGGDGGIHWGFTAFTDIPFSRSSNFLLGDYPSWFELNPSIGYRNLSG